MDKQAYFKMMGLDKQAQVDPNVLKNLLLGAGAGLGTYALSSFLPGARQNRLARLLASLGVGLGTGYFGTDIRNWFSNRSGKNQGTSDPTIEQENAQAQQLAMQQAEREQLERQQSAKVPSTETAATKTATPAAAQTTTATKTATPPAAQTTTATKTATPAAAQTTTATKTATPPAAAPTKDPYQAELDQLVAAEMRDVQAVLAKNPIRYMNANPVKIRQAIYKLHRADRDAWNANRGYPYKINPISLGREVRLQDFYPEVDKDVHEAFYGPLPRGVVNFMDNKGGRDL